jgi:hypothetical protein
MNRFVIASPDLQVWRLLRFTPCADSAVPQPARERESLCDALHAKPLGLCRLLEDCLL